jgi:hypothetical protein
MFKKPLHISLSPSIICKLAAREKYTDRADGSAVSGRARVEESRDEQLDHAAGIVARVSVGTNAEVADATHQFESSV